MAGLRISSDEFLKLPQKEKWKVMYENQVSTLDLVGGYKFHQKIHYVWLTALTGLAIFIIKQVVSI